MSVACNRSVAYFLCHAQRFNIGVSSVRLYLLIVRWRVTRSIPSKRVIPSSWQPWFLPSPFDLKLLGQNVAGILFEQHERFFESVMGQGRMSKAREEMRSERAMKMIAAFMRQCFRALDWSRGPCQSCLPRWKITDGCPRNNLPTLIPPIFSECI